MSQSQSQSQSQTQGRTQDEAADDERGGGNRGSGVDYEQEKQLLDKFFREHTILVWDNSDDPDLEYEPLPDSDDDRQGLRIIAYADHLQRIRDRDFYDDNKTFVVQVPLGEIADWAGTDPRRADLVTRIQSNTLRYLEVVAQVLDAILQNLPTSRGPNDAAEELIPDSVELLHRHRLAQQARQQAQRQRDQAEAMHNPHGGNGQLEDDEQQRQANNNGAGPDATQDFPPLLLRRYEVQILPPGRKGTLPPFEKQYHRPLKGKALEPQRQEPAALSLRHVRSPLVGHLVTLQGMIVRASEVKPCTVVATYSCDRCGAEIFQPTPNQREFMPPRICPACPRRNQSSAGSLFLQTRGGKFESFQELRLQELPRQVPMGHVPRTLSVHCRGRLCRQAAPGDWVTIDGIFLPQRLAESGFQALKSGLVTTTYLHAQHVTVHKKSLDEQSKDTDCSPDDSMITSELDKQLDEIANGADPLGRLAAAIAPEIFGHADVKRALLLQLVGGCTRKLPDGLQIRGDLNLCLMGDPGVAKSQLLKHVASIANRGVYTTGKGSSGVGLTAAVTKDLATGELSLEGGALVLADRGICCIDEFDKMDETDRTALHEVMEQQTVSIAKAGIVATLNARASVLAAANPLYGRYNRHKSLSENIHLPNSLLSRFDLLFLILDTPDVEKDTALARHVTLVHKTEGRVNEDEGDCSDSEESIASDDSGANERNKRRGQTLVAGESRKKRRTDGAEDDEDRIIEPHVLRAYIARARQHQPVVPPDVAPYIVEAYVSLRQEGNRSARRRRQVHDQTAMTARQLLSILRLSQALARLRFADTVARQDVDEAIRLTHSSKASLDATSSENGNDGQVREDATSRIFHVLRDAATASASEYLSMAAARAMVLRKGFTGQQLQICLDEYETLNVLQVNENNTQIYFLSN